MKRALALAPDDRTGLQARLLCGGAQLGATVADYGLMVDAARRGLDIATEIGDDRPAAGVSRSRRTSTCTATTPRPGGSAPARRYAEAAGDEAGADVSLVLEAVALTNGDRHEDARPVLDMVVERCRRRGDRLLLAFALGAQVYRALLTGDPPAARRWPPRRWVARPMAEHFSVSTSNLAWVTGVGGDIDGGLDLMRPVVRSAQGADHAVDAPSMAVTLGKLHLWGGDLEAARRWFERAARYGEPFVDNWFVARALPGLAAVYRRLGEADLALEHLERAAALCRKLDAPHPLAEAPRRDRGARLCGRARTGREPAPRGAGHPGRPRAADVLRGQPRRPGASCGAPRASPRPPGSMPPATRVASAWAIPGRPWTAVSTTPRSRPSWASLGDDDLAAAWSEGAELTLDEAVAYARRPDLPQPTVHRLGEPHADRARGRGPRRRRPHQPRDRGAAVHEPQHRQDPPLPRLHQARRHQPHRARRGRYGPRRPLRLAPSGRRCGRPEWSSA